MATETKRATTNTMKRAGSYDTFGKSLDSLLDRDVILRRYSIQERGLRDRETKEKEDRTFVLVYINEMDDADGVDPQIYHAWSGDLADKLAQIPNDDLPVLIKFMRVPTGGGFKVYTFE